MQHINIILTGIDNVKVHMTDSEYIKIMNSINGLYKIINNNNNDIEDRILITFILIFSYSKLIFEKIIKLFTFNYLIIKFRWTIFLILLLMYYKKIIDTVLLLHLLLF